MILLLLSERKLHLEAAKGERVCVELLPGGGASTEVEHGCLQTQLQTRLRVWNNKFRPSGSFRSSGFYQDC